MFCICSSYVVVLAFHGGTKVTISKHPDQFPWELISQVTGHQKCVTLYEINERVVGICQLIICLRLLIDNVNWLINIQRWLLISFSAG